MQWTFKQGNILDESADVLVCSANVFLNLSGGVGGEILHRYGDAMQKELHCYLAEHRLPHVEAGDVVPTSSCGTRFQSVLHAVAVNAFYETSPELVQTVVQKVLAIAASQGARKVALTALATGYGRMPLPDFRRAVEPLYSKDFLPIEEVVICVLTAEELAELSAESSARVSLSAKGRVSGAILGTAVGDALGLPAEGISPSRIKRLWPGSWHHRFLPGWGMISDDTEHAFFVVQALLLHPNDPKAFSRSLAWRLRWWVLALPAGVGLATLRSCIKLLLGFSPAHSGVFSAGNGPAMRSAVIGAYFADDETNLNRYVRHATTITHKDPRALVGALAVARVAAWSARNGATKKPDPREILAMLASLAPSDREWTATLDRMLTSCQTEASVEEFAAAFCPRKGVTGYIYHTVPVAIYAWIRHFGDFRTTLESALRCGGDTDTMGAIAGALAGTVVGENGIPREWISGIHDWPRSTRVLREAAWRLERRRLDGRFEKPVSYFHPGVLPRNLFFLVIVLLHGMRRLLPPY